MRNKYTGPCSDCGNIVRSGNGYFELRAGRFVVRCIQCVVNGKIAKGKPLSDAQKEALEEGRI